VSRLSIASTRASLFPHRQVWALSLSSPHLQSPQREPACSHLALPFVERSQSSLSIASTRASPFPRGHTMDRQKGRPAFNRFDASQSISTQSNGGKEAFFVVFQSLWREKVCYHTTGSSCGRWQSLHFQLLWREKVCYHYATDHPRRYSARNLSIVSASVICASITKLASRLAKPPTGGFWSYTKILPHPVAKTEICWRSRSKQNWR
jgi:hypothetical protein